MALAARFPRAEFLSGEPLLLMIRAVKTPAEIELLTRAAEINVTAIEALVAEIRPGVTEEPGSGMAVGRRGPRSDVGMAALRDRVAKCVDIPRR
jgi:hypothetical protein